MRPFTPLSIPEVPSYIEFKALASLPEDETGGSPSTNAKPSLGWQLQAKSLVENACGALRNARKEWDAISKVSPSKARTTHCEEWWRADVKNVQRACIAANIAAETAKKAVQGLGANCQPTDLKTILKVDMSDYGKGYHRWWVVPNITVVQRWLSNQESRPDGGLGHGHRTAG